MRKYLRFPVLLLGTICLITLTHAQNDRYAFAVTDLNQNGSGWNALRRLDLKSGEYSDILLNGTSSSHEVYDAATKKVYQPAPGARTSNYMKAPFGTGVAAMAFDKRNNRLYYTPMFIDQLRYIDLRTMKVYYVTDQAFTNLGNMHNSEGKIITRMVIAPDGNGYAVSNDGNTFIRFTTGKKLKISQLGPLVDDPSNDGVSIHNRCGSWGGDMIADDEGNLYIFSAYNNVYKIDIETKVASRLKRITGLPEGFSINGAVVNDNNKILASSAAYGKAWYVIDPKTWTATPYQSPNGIYRSSDLANSNYLTTKPAFPEFATRVNPGELIQSRIMLYPNPVSSDHFTLQFGKIPAGNYTIELTDVMGRITMRRIVNVSYEDQSETVPLKQISAKGVYLVKVVDQDSKSLFTQKLVVQ